MKKKIYIYIYILLIEIVGLLISCTTKYTILGEIFCAMFGQKNRTYCTVYAQLELIQKYKLFLFRPKFKVYVF